MKKLCLQFVAVLLFLALSGISRAAIVNGTVFCDANQDGVIATNDVGIPGVVVVIANENNSFSNAAVTAADGSFSIQIPDPSSSAAVRDPLSQVFVETLNTASLPAGSTIELPLAETNLTSTPSYFISFVTTTNQTNLVFTSGTGNSSTGDWLINDPECGSSAGNCKLSGNARIHGFNEVAHNFGGTIISGERPAGMWTDTSPGSNLQFRSTSIQSVICGTGSIEFTGTGILRSTGGHQPIVPHSGISVLFTAEVQSISFTTGRRTGTAQAYYLRVFTADGTTLELESLDAADPTDIAPVPITVGILRLRSDE